MSVSDINGPSHNQLAEDGQPNRRLSQHDRLCRCNSYERLAVLCGAMALEDDHHERMALFLEYWSICDAPWGPWCPLLAKMLRYTLKHVSLPQCLPEEAREQFNALPPEIEIYRGCQRYRERGLSWTTDLNVAQKFARGVRCCNSVPTLVSARIPKQHIFGVFTDRDESEIVVDYRRLRRLRHLELHQEAE